MNVRNKKERPADLLAFSSGLVNSGQSEYQGVLHQSVMIQSVNVIVILNLNKYICYILKEVSFTSFLNKILGKYIWWQTSLSLRADTGELDDKHRPRLIQDYN